MPKPAPGRDFYIATADEIRAGRTTDLYFVRTLDILKKAGRSRANVVAEVTTGALPNDWPWGIFCGLEEVVHLLEGKGVSLWALPEGSVFPPKTHRGIPLPVMILEGPYEEWALYETPVLGMICQASGIATKAARIRKLANGKQVLSFGVRRMHPGIAPLIERSVTIGGLDAITTPLGADLLGVPAIGTMPHALVIVMGGPREAFAAVHKYLEAKIPRIALVDTYYDEKTEALMAGEAGQVRRPQRPSALPEGRHVRSGRANVSGVRRQDGPGIHPALGTWSRDGAAAGSRCDSRAGDARDGAGHSRSVSEPLSRGPRVSFEWSERKRTSARRTIASPNRTRPVDENLGPRSGCSSSPCLGGRGSSMSEPAMDDTRRSSRTGAIAPWRSTSPDASC